MENQQPQSFDVIANYTRNQRRYQNGDEWNQKSADALDNLLEQSSHDFNLNLQALSDVATQRANYELDCSKQPNLDSQREIAVLNDLQHSFMNVATNTYRRSGLIRREKMQHKVGKLAIKGAGILRKYLKNGAMEAAKVTNARLEALEELQIRLQFCDDEQQCTNDCLIGK